MKTVYRSNSLFFLITGIAVALLLILFMYLPEEGDNENTEMNQSVEEVARMPLSPGELKISLEELVISLDTIGPISSLLISQHGDLLTEQYYGSMNPERGSNIKSASKSILSILTGIAIERGYLDGVDQQIGDFFPEYFESNPDSVKAAITIEDLLTMRSGLASTSRSNYGRWVTSSNWVYYKLDRLLSGTPGKDRIYSTGNTHLLAVILAKASGMNTLQFANKYLFGPMDILVTGWDRDPQGFYLGGNNMAIRPRDMVKIGRLMMDIGKYKGEQLISADWVIKSVIPVTGRISGVQNYGYLWFRRMSGKYHMVYAYGNGGQYILILPELEAVITVTTRTGTGEPTWNYRRQLFTMIDKDIVSLLEAGYTEI